MARAIIRISFEKDGPAGAGGAARRQVVDGVIQQAGFTTTGTATWEKDGLLPDLSKVLSDVLAEIGRLPAPATLDHVWVYLDEKRVTAAADDAAVSKLNEADLGKGADAAPA